jgi:hypothetical protein
VATDATYDRPARRPIDGRQKLSMFALATVVLLGGIGSAFAAGWLIGRMLL